jgi:hypothetical protein
MQVTIFQNLEANVGKTIDIPFRDLPEFLTARNPDAPSKESLPLFVASEFGATKTTKGSIRHDKNVTSVTALVFDYDAGKVSILDAARAFEVQGIDAVIAPTASWTATKPKFRVVVPIAVLHGPTDYLKARRKELIEEIATLTGIAFSSETKTLSQSYYFGLPRSMPEEAQAVSIGYGKEFTPETGSHGSQKPPKTGPNSPGQGIPHPGGKRTHLDEGDIARLEQVLETGVGEVHQAMLSLSMAGLNRGMPAGSVIKYIQGLMLNWADNSERYNSRYADIPRIVEGAARRIEQERWEEHEVPDDHGVVPPDINYVRGVLSGQIIVPPQKMVVSGYLPLGKAGGFVAPGGTGKSTLLLYESIHIMLGRPLYGLEISHPGPVVYFSAEDDTDLVLFRLGKIARAMSLSVFECEKVAAGFTVLPVLLANPDFQLVVDDFGNCRSTPWVKWSVDQIRSRGAVVAVMDPVSLIGPGERSMNDGMARLMKVGNQIGHEAGCAVRYVHHETKSTERRFDQYSGRGGAAFADNSRSMVQMISLRGHRDEQFSLHGVNYLVPPSLGATEDDYMNGRVVGLLRHKLSAEELDVTPIFMLRRGFEYSWDMGIAEVSDAGRALAEDRRARSEAEAEERRAANLAANTERRAGDILSVLRGRGTPLGVTTLHKAMVDAGFSPGDKESFGRILQELVRQGVLETVEGAHKGSIAYRPVSAV